MTSYLYDPNKYKFYQLISSYFDSPQLQKVKEDDLYSIYVCKIQTLLLNEYRYLVAVVYKDSFPIGHILPLTELKWISFQTRILESDIYYNVVTHNYQIKNTHAYYFKVFKISSCKENTMYSVQSNEYPIQILLIHQKGLDQEYPVSGTLVSCLETYQTILTFKTQ